MAKRVIWTSDVIKGIEFSSEEKMRDFDETLNSKKWIINCCKNYIVDYIDDIDIDEVNELGNGHFEIVFYNKNLAEYIKNKIQNIAISDTYFDSLIDLIDNYEDITYTTEYDEMILEHIEEKIDEYANEINALVKFTVAQ